MAYRLRVEKLRAAAHSRGDHTGYAIHKRTGLNESTVSRILNGKSQPGTKSLARICAAYGVTVDELMAPIEPTTRTPARAAA